MKHWLSLVLIGVLGLGLVGFNCDCSSKKSTGPDDGGGGDEVEWKLRSTQPVNSSGGEIKVDSLTLVIPSGVLSDGTQLDVYTGEAETGIASWKTTDLYGISFSPVPAQDIMLEVRIRMSTSQSESGVVRLYAGGKDSGVSYDYTPYIFYGLADSKLSGSELSGRMTILGTSSSVLNRGSSRPGQTVTPSAVCGSTSNRDSSAHFIIEKAPGSTIPLQTYLGYLEQIYTVIRDSFGIPVDTIISRRDNIKIPVYFGDTGTNDQGDKNLGMYYQISNCIYITDDQTILNSMQPADIKAVVGHEFFHFVQYNLYISRASLSNSYTWLGEASSCYLEYVMDNPDRVIDVGIANSQFFESGIEGSSAPKARGHGYGVSYFMKYLAERFGNRILGRIWTEIGNQSYGMRCSSRAIDKILYDHYQSSVGLKASVDWEFEAFMVKLLERLVTQRNKHQMYLIDNFISNRWSIESGQLSFSETRNYPDVSAWLYRITLSSAQAAKIKDSASLIVSINPGTFFNFYVFDGTGKQQIGQAITDSSLTVKNIKNYSELFVLVVNSYKSLYFDSQKSCTFTAVIDTTTPKWSELRLIAAIPRTYKETIVMENTDIYPGDYVAGLGPYMSNWYHRIKWEGRNFSIQWDTTYDYYGSTIYDTLSITGLVAADWNSIVSCQVSHSNADVEVSDTYSRMYYGAESFQVSTIPIHQNIPYFDVIYRLYGKDQVRAGFSNLSEFFQIMGKTGGSWTIAGKWELDSLNWDKPGFTSEIAFYFR